MVDDITQILAAHRSGDPEAFERLIPLVYDDLRGVAHNQLVRGRPGETLNTTAVVHEAYLRLVGKSRITIDDRVHFFALASRIMRQIIVDYAKRKTAGKRGGGKAPVSLDTVSLGEEGQAEVMLLIDEALTRLTELNDRLTRVFECRYFVGMNDQETAEALNLSVRTVQRDWQKSRAWLRAELSPS